MLLFDPKPPFIYWNYLSQASPKEGEVRMDHHKTLKAGLMDLPDEQNTVAYVLSNGGNEFTQTVSRINSETLRKIELTTVLPLHENQITAALIKSGLKRWSNAEHLLLCETAFFHNLPKAIRSYALPADPRTSGICRFGGDGLCHRWVWMQIHNDLSDTLQRVVSVHLDEHPNVCALLDDIAIETSLGFSPIEGLPSITSSGDLDPTVVLMLRENGLSIEQIETILSQQSGFTALMGLPTNLSSLLTETTPQADAARQLLYHKLLEAIGGAIASLGGLDALVFTCSELANSLPFIQQICSGLEFLQIQYNATQEKNSDSRMKLSSDTSKVQVYGLKYNRWNALIENIRCQSSDIKRSAMNPLS